MLRKPSHLALIAVAAFSAATLMACSSGSPFLRYLAVSPSSATIIVPGNVESSVRRGAMVASRSSKVKKQLASAPDLNGAGCSTFQYSTTAYFSDGTQRDATSSVVYGSSNTNVATVDAGGVATGLIPGTSQISSQFNGITATPVTLYVNALNSISILPVNSSVPSGGTANFTSTGTFTYWDGTTGSQDLSGVAVWASSNTDVATIDPTSGVATAVGGGSTTISSTVCGVAASTSLTVGSAKPVSLVVTPSSSIIAVGQTQAYTVQELWSDGSKHDVTGNLGWTGNESVLTDEETGLSVGKSAGSGSIGVSEVGTTLTGTSSIDVVPAAARFAYVANTGGAGDLVAQKVTARAATLKSHARPAVKATPQATPQAASTETISAYSVNVTGASLTPITGATTAAIPQQVILHPSGKFLYYIDFNSNLYVLDVNPATGALSVPSPAINSVVAGNGGVDYGTIDPTGRFLYVVDDASTSDDNPGSIWGFTINQADGTLTPIDAVTEYETNVDYPAQPLIDATGKYLYCVNSDADNISQYSIDQTTGAITPLDTETVATGEFPAYGSINAAGNLYVANNTSSSSTQSVSGFHIGSGGQLQSVGAPTVVPTATSMWNVASDPTGAHIFPLDFTTSISLPGQVFSYHATPSAGVIGSAIGSAVPTGFTSQGMAVDPTGVFLAIDNFDSSTISLFKIGADGSLSASPTPTVATGTGPEWVVFYTAADPSE